MKIYLLLGLFPRTAVDALEDVKETEFQTCFAARILRDEQRSFCKQKLSADDFKSVATLSFHKIVSQKMVAMISLKMRNS